MALDLQCHDPAAQVAVLHLGAHLVDDEQDPAVRTEVAVGALSVQRLGCDCLAAGCGHWWLP